MIGRERKGREVVVWPAYLDSTLPRSRGRRVPLGVAVRKPTVDEIVAAAKSLGLDPKVEDSSYPRDPFSSNRRVVVRKVGPKRKILVDIALKVREGRARRS